MVASLALSVGLAPRRSEELLRAGILRHADSLRERASLREIFLAHPHVAGRENHAHDLAALP